MPLRANIHGRVPCRCTAAITSVAPVSSVVDGLCVRRTVLDHQPVLTPLLWELTTSRRSDRDSHAATKYHALWATPATTQTRPTPMTSASSTCARTPIPAIATSAPLPWATRGRTSSETVTVISPAGALTTAGVHLTTCRNSMWMYGPAPNASSTSMVRAPITSVSPNMEEVLATATVAVLWRATKVVSGNWSGQRHSCTNRAVNVSRIIRQCMRMYRTSGTGSGLPPGCNHGEGNWINIEMNTSNSMVFCISLCHMTKITISSERISQGQCQSHIVYYAVLCLTRLNRRIFPPSVWANRHNTNRTHKGNSFSNSQLYHKCMDHFTMIY